MLRPLGDRVIAERIEDERNGRSAGGVVLPDMMREKPTRALVIRVGPGARTVEGNIIPMEVEAGDVVLFNKYAGVETSVDGKDVLILRAGDLLGVEDNGGPA